MEVTPADPSSSPSRPAGEPVSRAFFERSSAEVGRDLIGKVLWRDGVGGGRLTEVEAYLPEDDPACHAYRGRTARNAAMFGAPGTIYVFRSYGIHLLLNLVCDVEGVGSAVLVRSFEPLGDTRRLQANRGMAVPRALGDSQRQASFRRLGTGPGRVGQALAVGLDLNGRELGEASGVFVIDDGRHADVACSTRIGISRGDTLQLRYYLQGSSYISGSRPTKGEGT